jgi:uncharacterized membrane protein
MISEFIFLGFGIFGVLLIGTAFILEVFNKLHKNHHSFALMNLTGSFLLFLYSYYNKVWLFVILNGLLVIVGIYGYYKSLKK